MRVGGGGGDAAEDLTAVVPGTTLRTVLRKEVVWDPRGWWIHSSALVEGNQRHARGQSQHLFPVRSVDAMRAAIVALEEGKLPEFAWATFKSYWEDLNDISQPAALEDICRSVGLDWDEVSERIKSDSKKVQSIASAINVAKNMAGT